MSRLRALVLEDEWPARNYLVQLIEATQLAEVVGAVASIGEAREVLAGLPVDVVFVDVQLSGGENGGLRSCWRPLSASMPCRRSISAWSII